MLPRVEILDTGIGPVQKMFRGHSNETFVPLNGGRSQQPAIQFFKSRTKISLRKLWVVYARLKNEKKNAFLPFLSIKLTNRIRYRNDVYLNKNPVLCFSFSRVSSIRKQLRYFVLFVCMFSLLMFSNFLYICCISILCIVVYRFNYG